ncbi:hypothetical protein Fmac_028238 [Flemingia macrophylla]|uniref:Uncharacterized protein n=1 Tax=Flemingia macrophylla TaxID=520843 RepID=A0ABD1L6X2_9FABA
MLAWRVGGAEGVGEGFVECQKSKKEIEIWCTKIGVKKNLDGELWGQLRLHDIYYSHVCMLNCELSEALYVVEQKVREAVAMSSKVQKEIMLKENEDST